MPKKGTEAPSAKAHEGAIAVDPHGPMPDYILKDIESDSRSRVWEEDTHDGNDDLDPADLPCRGLNVIEQILLALVDGAAVHAILSREQRFEALLDALSIPRRIWVPLPPVPNTGADGEGWLRNSAYLWMAEEREKSVRRKLRGSETAAQQLRVVRKTRPTSLRSVSKLAAAKFYPNLQEDERASKAKSLADGFAGYDSNKEARKERREETDWRALHRLYAVEHDGLSDSLNTRSAIEVCLALKKARVPIQHPEIQ